jgi:hypothetical protein
MATVLARVERPCAIRQEISAGGNFNGTEPSGSPTFADDTFKFAAEAAGGLFDFTSAKYAFEDPEPLWLTSLQIALANQSAWTVGVVDVDSKETQIAAGTTEASYVRGADDPVLLLWGDKIKITTTGATAAMLAAVKVAPYRHKAW